MSQLKTRLFKPEYSILLIILAFGCVVQAVSGQFFTMNTLVSLCRSMMLPLIFAVGEMLALICVGPDVSFPAVACLSAYVTASYFKSIHYEGPIVLVLLAGAAIGLAAGAVNGLILAKYQFPSLIVTLGMSTFLVGFLNGPLRASNVMNIAPAMENFGRSSLFTVTNARTGLQANFPTAFLLVIVLYLAAYLVLRYTMAGRGVYAIGGNVASARSAGFPVRAIIFGLFCFIGLMAGIGGVVCTCMNYTYNMPDLIGSEMDIIAAVILGGVRPGKGVGSLRNAVLGVMLLTMVNNNLLLLGIPLYWQKAFTGAIILLGMIASVRAGSKKRAVRVSA